MQKPIARSPERQRLSDAIERHRERADDLDRIERAIAKITDDRIEDRVAIGRARDVVSIARGAQSDILVMRALGEELFDQPDLAAAERTLAECEASLDASRSALKTLEQERERVRSTLDLAEGALKRAIAEVVTADPALATLKAEYARTMARAARLWSGLRVAGVTVEYNIVRRLDDDPNWTAALAALRENPDEVLPDLPPDEPLDDARPGGRRAA